MLPQWTLVFIAGMLTGAVSLTFIAVQIGLLYRLDSPNSEHLTADEVDFDEAEKLRSHWPVETRLENISVYPAQTRSQRSV